MRHKISVIGVLLLALSLSGWSSALAVALSCPRASGEQSRAVVAQDRSTQDHACCHAQTAHARPHCPMPQHQEMGGGMSGMQMMHVADTDAGAVSQPAGPCAHCITQPELPATQSARQTNRIKPGIDAALHSTPTPLARFASLFTPAVQSRQGAPPGTQARKHLLISVFII